MDSNNNFTDNNQPQYNNQYYQQDMNQNYQYQQNTYQNNGYQAQPNAYQNNGYQAQSNAYQNNGYQAQGYQQMAPKRPVEISQDVKYNQYGMRWFLFMVWGYLIYGVINNISSALQMFKLADLYSEYSYGGLDELSPMILIEGVLLLVIAVYCFYTRKLLMKFSVKAPKAVVICVACPLASVIIFILGACITSDLELEEIVEVIGSLMASGESWGVWLYIILYGVIIYGNVVYFKNRKHLFNNQEQIKLI